MRRLLPTLLALFGAALATVACSDDATNRATTPDAGSVSPESTPRVEYMQASWAFGYDSVEQLAENANIVVVGTVGAVADAGFMPGSDIPFTDRHLRVEETLKGDRAAETVVVHQTGGIASGQLREFEDDPLLVEGQRYLLFLKSVGGGRYAVLGGPAGRMSVDGTTASPLSKTYPDRHIDDHGIVSQPLSDIRKAIAGIGFLSCHRPSARQPVTMENGPPQCIRWLDTFSDETGFVITATERTTEVLRHEAPANAVEISSPDKLSACPSGFLVITVTALRPGGPTLVGTVELSVAACR